MKKIIYILTTLFIVLVSVLTFESPSKEVDTEKTFYIGSYTGGNSQGIYKYSLLDNGNIDSIGLAVKTKNPSFIAKSENNKYLLAVSENNTGSIKSFKINEENLKLISEESSGGSHPCFVSINRGKYILVANYTSGNIGLLKLDNEGKLSKLSDVQQHFGNGSTERQKHPHAHSVWFEPNSNTIISVDLGTNELLFSSIEFENQKFIPSTQKKLKLDAGAGPRHLAFHPFESWIYTINELNSTISLIKKQKNHYTLESSFSALPKDFKEKNNSADIHISNDGKFLYASNRGHNSIVIFSIESDGTLILLGHESTRGNWPRNFSLSPDNDFLLVANQYSNTIVSFKRDTKTGLLEYVATARAPSPTCILF